MKNLNKSKFTLLFLEGNIYSSIMLGALLKNNIIPTQVVYIKNTNIIIPNYLSEIELANSFLNNFDLSMKFCLNSLSRIKNYINYYEFTTHSINSIEFIEFIKRNIKGAILFTGGGILSKEILSIDDVKFIHIHPGIIPDIRGSDGILWSFLLRKKLGYSVFYMNSGIDTGCRIHTKEFSNLLFLEPLKSLSRNDQYRYLLKYYCSLLRALTFLEVVKTNRDLYYLECFEPDSGTGNQYFGMHQILKDKVLEKMISK